MQAVSKPLLKYRRQGRVCTLFMDPASNTPISISSFEGDDTAFPMVLKEDEIQAKFGARYHLVPIDPPNQGPPPEADAHIAEEDLDKALEAGDKAAEAFRKQHGIAGDGRQERLKLLGTAVATPQGATTGYLATSPIPPTPSSPDVNGPLAFSVIQERVFRELETMFAKRSVATGKTQKELSTEINNVANFLLRVEPGMKEALITLSERHKQQERVEF